MGRDFSASGESADLCRHPHFLADFGASCRCNRLARSNIAGAERPDSNLCGRIAAYPAVRISLGRDAHVSVLSSLHQLFNADTCPASLHTL